MHLQRLVDKEKKKKKEKKSTLLYILLIHIQKDYIKEQDKINTTESRLFLQPLQNGRNRENSRVTVSAHVSQEAEVTLVTGLAPLV